MFLSKSYDRCFYVLKYKYEPFGGFLLLLLFVVVVVVVCLFVCLFVVFMFNQNEYRCRGEKEFPWTKDVGFWIREVFLGPYVHE